MAGGYGYASPSTMPKTRMVGAVIALLCFWPTGIPAVVNASRVKSRWRAGDGIGAETASRNAFRWSLASWIMGLVGVVFWVVFFALFATTYNQFVTDARVESARINAEVYAGTLNVTAAANGMTVRQLLEQPPASGLDVPADFDVAPAGPQVYTDSATGETIRVKWGVKVFSSGRGAEEHSCVVDLTRPSAAVVRKSCV